ncbi:MAG: acyltransferase [Chloroflexi bacterium]|nr:acyltransferase [Chloroflexota bacterium]
MIVRCALIQGRARETKQAIIDRHMAMIDEAAAKGAQITCLQEVFFGPFFPQVIDRKWFDIFEPIPGPTVSLMQETAKKHNMVLIVPIAETAGVGLYYNAAAIIDADGKLLGTYRKNHIPMAPGGFEKYYFKPGNLGYPVFQTAYAKIGVLICYDRQFPEAARILGLRGAEIVFIPAATFKGLVDYLWFLGQRVIAASNEYFVGTLNRVGTEADLGPAEFYGSSYFCDPRGNILAQAGETEEEVLVADLDLEKIKEVRTARHFYRDRRPDTYQDLVQPLP